MNLQLTKTVAGIIAPMFLFNPVTSYLMRKAREKDVPKYDVTFTMYDYDEPMDVHTKAQENFLIANTDVSTPRYNGKSELSKPAPAELAWTYEADGDVEFDKYKVYFGEDKSFRDADVYVTENDVIKIYNVKLDTTYYWYVSAEYEGCVYKSEVSSFKTGTTAPRNLFVEGVTNVRDMGGWKCDGGRVKQCMIYRTGKLHDDDSVNITEEGKKTMLDELGIKTEIDLRFEVSPADHGSLGKSVNYVLLPMDFSDDMMLDDAQAEKICAFFKVLADKDNYPIFFHCMIGTDRTGLCAFLLNGLLGVAEEDLYRDYKFSNLGFIGGVRDGHNIEHDLKLLEKFDGDTTAERIENYLLSIGVTAEEIKSIRSIMIEKD